MKALWHRLFAKKTRGEVEYSSINAFRRLSPTVSPASVTDETIAAQVVRLIEALENNDDVQHVHTNFEPCAEALARISA